MHASSMQVHPEAAQEPAYVQCPFSSPALGSLVPSQPITHTIAELVPIFEKKEAKRGLPPHQLSSVLPHSCDSVRLKD